jgi:hypothetical protein
MLNKHFITELYPQPQKALLDAPKNIEKQKD